MCSYRVARIKSIVIDRWRRLVASTGIRADKKHGGAWRTSAPGKRRWSINETTVGVGVVLFVFVIAGSAMQIVLFSSVVVLVGHSPLAGYGLYRRDEMLRK